MFLIESTIWGVVFKGDQRPLGTISRGSPRENSTVQVKTWKMHRKKRRTGGWSVASGWAALKVSESRMAEPEDCSFSYAEGPPQAKWTVFGWLTALPSIDSLGLPGFEIRLISGLLPYVQYHRILNAPMFCNLFVVTPMDAWVFPASTLPPFCRRPRELPTFGFYMVSHSSTC